MYSIEVKKIKIENERIIFQLSLQTENCVDFIKNNPIVLHLQRKQFKKKNYFQKIIQMSIKYLLLSKLT